MMSLGVRPRASAARAAMALAFCTPSALQVLALPELQTTAWAVPSLRCSLVTAMGAPNTLFWVYMAAAVQGVSQAIMARSFLSLFLRTPQCSPPATKPLGAQTPPSICVKSMVFLPLRYCR